MDEQLAALAAVFEQAGIALPDDPTSFALDELDGLVADRRLRAMCKSALTKFKRAATAAGWAPAAAAAPEPLASTPPPEPTPAPAEPVAPAAPVAAAPPVAAAAPVVIPASPMSDELAARHTALRDCCEQAGLALPDDPTTVDLDSLDAAIVDKSLRGKVKSALVKFRKQAAAEGWQASRVEVAAAPAGAAPAPSPDPVAAPAAEPVVVPASPMSPELQEKYAAVTACYGQAGVAVPTDPTAVNLDELDTLVEDKSLRGKLKSALVKFRKQAAAEAWQAGGVVVAAPTVSPAAAPPASAAAVTEMVEEVVQEIEEEVAGEAAPLSAALSALFAEVTAAFAATGTAVPADPLNVGLDTLDEAIDDKKLRGRCKSALTKFRRVAKEEGWQPGGVRKVKRTVVRQVVRQVGAAPAAVAPPTASGEVPAAPVGPPAELYLLTAGGWEKLGTASRQTTQHDDLVAQRTAAGATRRITSILTLDGTFKVPEDLYNTYCWLAHEGVVYKAYYISHVGDVKRGTKTASLKVDESYDYETFGRVYLALAKPTRPTADDARRVRFGTRYDSDRRMFAGVASRLV
ncbi:MAG: hypothetical protein IT204_21875 [Fimbriimonadaceae bacterium]|nr:hypothetical protein [Fimbriimonadaceae bacterium]